MNKAKALLDSLMGPNRDVAMSQRSGEDFKDKGVCKHFVVGFCPHTVLGGKVPESTILEGKCKKLHSAAMQSEYKEHKDHEKYRREYEGGLLKFLLEIVGEKDSRKFREQRKKRPKETVTRIPDHLKVQVEAYEEKIAKYSKICREKEREGDGIGKEEAENEIEKAEERIMNINKTHTHEFPGEEVCEACGVRYLLGAVNSYQEQDHFKTDMHKGYVQIKEKLEDLQAKQRKGEIDGAPAEDDRRRGRSRSGGGKDDDRKKGRSRSGGRDDDKKKGRSRSGGGKDDDKKKGRSRSGGGKDDDKKKGRSRSRGGKDDDREDDRDRGRKDKDKDDDRGRDRDRSRSRDRRRGRDNDRDRDRDRDRDDRRRDDKGRDDRRRRDDRSRSRDRRRSPSRDRRRSRSRDRRRH